MNLCRVSSRQVNRTLYFIKARRIHLRQAEGPADPSEQARKAGLAARESSNTHPLDAASPNPQYKPYVKGSGNKEQIGFVEQVGGQSFSADHFEFGKSGGLIDGELKGGVHEPMDPGFLAGAGKAGTQPGKRVQEREARSSDEGRVIGQSQKLARKLTGSFVDGEVSMVEEYEARRTIKQNQSDAVSGMWSNAGVPGSAESRDYRTVDKDDPYDPPEANRDQKLRYGGRHWRVEKDSESS